MRNGFSFWNCSNIPLFDIVFHTCTGLTYVCIRANTSFRPTSLLGLRIRVLGFRCFAFEGIPCVSHAFFDVFGVSGLGFSIWRFYGFSMIIGFRMTCAMSHRSATS